MSEKERIAVGHRLRLLRERRGWERLQLAEMLGVHSGSIARWETGGAVPHAYTMERIAELCEASSEWIRTGRGESPIPDDEPEAVEGEAPLEPETAEVFASLDAVSRFVEGIGPAGQERLRKLDALEGLRRMLTARGVLPDWWYDLRDRVENAQL
ncbi:MAG TPA: helix-turn-helix transcriptional regulator [Longimicrobium sp.]|nr:helix-turn-helix transcriptional regulator [Longimicrobium sp.]